MFKEVDVAELSSIKDILAQDMHAAARWRGHSYPVDTISLGDLLEKHNAPREIDYLSIDTEGSEFEILSSFFRDQKGRERYRFTVITCEHNYTDAKERIYDLPTENGYKRKFEKLSKFDDWYVRE